MGVDGLTAYVKQHFNDMSQSLELQPGDRLLIDGNSLLYHLLSRYRSLHGCDEFNFDGLEFANSIVQYLWPFTCRGVDLTIVMDGMLDMQKKLATRMSRRTYAWASIRRLLLQGRAKSVAYKTPWHKGSHGTDCHAWIELEKRTAGRQILPQRAMDIMIIILRMLDNITLLCAPYEADPYIAHLVKQSFLERDSDKTFRGVVTNDSDFLIYGCDLGMGEIHRRKYLGYIPYDQVRMNCNENDEFEIYVKGVTPHALARMLRLRHVMLLPLLSVVCGNDYVPPGWLLPERTIANVSSRGKAYFVGAAGRYIGDSFGRAGHPEILGRRSITSILKQMDVHYLQEVKLDKVMEVYGQYLAIDNKVKNDPESQDGCSGDTVSDDPNINFKGLFPSEICPTLSDERKRELYHCGYISSTLLTMFWDHAYFGQIPLENETEDLGFSEHHWSSVRHKLFKIILPIGTDVHTIREYMVRSMISDATEISHHDIRPDGMVRNAFDSIMKGSMEHDRVLDFYAQFCLMDGQVLDGIGTQLRSKIIDIVRRSTLLEETCTALSPSSMELLVDSFLNMAIVCRVMHQQIGFSASDIRDLVAACLYCMFYRVSVMKVETSNCISYVLQRSIQNPITVRMLLQNLISCRTDEMDSECSSRKPQFGVIQSFGSTHNQMRYYGQGKSYNISSSFFTGLQYHDLLNQQLNFAVDKDSFTPLLLMFSVKDLAEIVEGTTEIEQYPLIQQTTESIMNNVILG